MKDIKFDNGGFVDIADNKLITIDNGQYLNPIDYELLLVAIDIINKIGISLSTLDGENGMIKLDKNNSAHVDWFEDE